MIIEKTEIHGFRALREVNLNCDQLTSIIGRNGCGKSSLLKAIDVFFNVAFQANQYDYFAKDSDSEIRITITFSNLKPEEITTFGPYVSAGNLTVTKIINADGQRYFGSMPQLLEFFEIRKNSPKEKIRLYKEFAQKHPALGLNPSLKSEVDVDKEMSQYEQYHPEKLEPCIQEHQFFGPKNIGGGKLDNLTKFVLIPAVRDAVTETERRGVILQLVDALVTRSINAREDVRKLNADFEQRVKEVYSNDNLTELKNLAQMVTKVLGQYAPGAVLDLDFDEAVPPKITLPAALASLVEDNFKTPISYSGHGLQRALILALLQQLSVTDVSATSDQSDPDSNPSPVLAPDLILAIQEPELYLHPSRSRFLASVLRKLAHISTGPTDSGIQVLLATHSPYFIELRQFNSIRMARKVQVAGMEAKECKITSYSLDDAAAALAKLTGKDKSNFSAKSFVARANPVMNSIVNEGFFADLVVVVEGLSELGALWAIQDIKGMKWEELGIVIVPAEGKSKIDRPVVVFGGLDIPTYFIFDGDIETKGTKEEANSIALNSILLKLGNVGPIPFPATQVRKEFACFEGNLETEMISAVGNEYFQKTREAIAIELGYSEPSKALKNLDATAEFIRRAYAHGKTMPILESIVASITELRSKS